MKVTTLRLPEDLVEDLDEEYAEYGHGNRSEYVRWLLERRDRIRENTENTPSYSDRDTENTLADRFDDLEARLAALEQRLDTTGDREAADAPREPPEENPSGHHRDPPESLEDVGAPPERASDDDLVTAVRRYLSNRPPKTGHGKDALVDAFELLREHGTMKTGDLKTALFEAYSEHYGGERAMWESTSRYLDDVPGVEKGGYGEWTYAGDEAARDALGGSGGVYDPTEEFA
jgi:Arc/MetJ-type ribon-helix-helix transcriptional regulator